MRALLLLALIAAPFAAGADTDDASDSGSVGGHWVSAGSSVEVSEPHHGNAFLAGEYLSVKAPVSGSVFALGAHLDVSSSIDKWLFAAAESIRIAGTVRDHARLVGENVELTPSSRLEGPVSIAARSVTLAGELSDGGKVTARSVRVDGHVAGDLEVIGEEIEVGPGARIDGRLRYRGEHAPQVADGAEIHGGTERLGGRFERFGWWSRDHHFGPFGRSIGLGTALVLGVVMLLLGPAFMSDTSAIARREWATSLGIGFMVLVGVPFAAVLLIITLIGIPVALLAIALYAALLMLGYACGAIALGDLGLQTFAPGRAASTGARVLALLATLLLLGLLRHVTLLGGLLVFVVFLAGVGALLQRAFRKAPPASAA